MTLQIPAGFGQVIHSLLLTGDPEPMAVTYGVQLEGQAPTDAQVTINDLHAAFASTMLGVPHNSYQLRQSELRYVVAELGPVQVAIQVSAITAGGTGAPLPQNSALLYHKRSNSAGRRNRGRFYLPGVGEGTIDGVGRIDPAQMAALNNLGTNFLAGVRASASVAEMVILHSLGISPAGPPTVVTKITCDPVIATQRRRLRK